jgi:hypothetical protein
MADQQTTLSAAASQSLRFPELERLQQSRRRLQQDQLQQYQEEKLDPFIELYRDASSSKGVQKGWYRHIRLVGDPPRHEDNHCIIAPSIAVPGLSGVFATNEFRVRPAPGSVGEANSFVACYIGVLMLRAEFDDFQALYHHDMGVEVTGLMGRSINQDGSRGPSTAVILAGSPLCAAAQILRCDGLNRANCIINVKERVSRMVSDKEDESLPIHSVTMRAIKKIGKGKELMCDYATTWIDAASCFICCLAVQQEELSATNPTAFRCQGFPWGKPCLFTVHRHCLTRHAVPESQPYCHYCFSLSANENPLLRLLQFVELTDEKGQLDCYISSNLSFATVRAEADRHGYIVESALIKAHDLVEYRFCERRSAVSASPNIGGVSMYGAGTARGALKPPAAEKDIGVALHASPSSSNEGGLAQLAHSSPSQLFSSREPSEAALMSGGLTERAVSSMDDSAVGTSGSPVHPAQQRTNSGNLQSVFRSSSASGQTLAPPTKLLSDVLQRMSIGFPTSGVSLHAAPPTASFFDPLRDALLPLPATSTNTHGDSGGTALNRLASCLSAAGYVPGTWNITRDRTHKSQTFRAVALEMTGWADWKVLQQRYRLPDQSTAQNSQIDEIHTRLTGCVHDLITKPATHDALIVSPIPSFRKSFHLVHLVGPATATTWLATVWEKYADNIELPLRDVIVQLFSEARALVVAQCLGDDQWDKTAALCWNEASQKDCTTQKQHRMNQLEALLNHCRGAKGDASEDVCINAPLIIDSLASYHTLLDSRWRLLVSQFDPEDGEGLVHTIMFDWLRRVSHELSHAESPVRAQWSPTHARVSKVTNAKQEEIMAFIKRQTWNDEAVLDQAKQAEYDRAVRLRAVLSVEPPTALQLTAAQATERDIAVALEYLIRVAYCNAAGIPIAAATLHSVNLHTESGSRASAPSDPESAALSALAVGATTSTVLTLSASQDVGTSSMLVVGASTALVESDEMVTSVEEMDDETTDSDANMKGDDDGNSEYNLGDSDFEQEDRCVSEPNAVNASGLHSPLHVSDSTENTGAGTDLQSGISAAQVGNDEGLGAMVVVPAELDIGSSTVLPDSSNAGDGQHALFQASLGPEAERNKDTLPFETITASVEATVIEPVFLFPAEEASFRTASASSALASPPLPSKSSTRKQPSMLIELPEAIKAEMAALHRAHVERVERASRPNSRHLKKLAKGGKLSRRGQLVEERMKKRAEEPISRHCDGHCSAEAFHAMFSAFSGCCAETRKKYITTTKNALNFQEMPAEMQQLWYHEHFRQLDFLYASNTITVLYGSLLNRLEVDRKTDLRQQFKQHFGPIVKLKVERAIERGIARDSQSPVGVDSKDGEGGLEGELVITANSTLSFAEKLKLFDLTYENIPVCLPCYICTNPWLNESTVRKWVHEVVDQALRGSSIGFSEAKPRRLPLSASGEHGNSLKQNVSLKTTLVKEIIYKLARYRGDATPDDNVTVLVERTCDQVHLSVSEEFAKLNRGSVSKSTVKAVLAKMPHIKRSGKHQTLPTCNLCREYFALSKPTQTQREQWILHNAVQESERTELSKNIMLANANPDVNLYLAIDGMDQAKTELPHLTQMPHWREANFTPLKVHVTGAMVHGPNLTMAFTHYENVHTGGNLTVHLLHLALKRVWAHIAESIASQPPQSSPDGVQQAGPHRFTRYPENLFLQMDNSGKDNKNNAVFKYLALLVHRGIFNNIVDNFLLVGHTHDRVDQFFSCISRELQNNDALTHEHLLSCIRDAYSRPMESGGRQPQVAKNVKTMSVAEKSQEILSDAEASSTDSESEKEVSDQRFSHGLTLDPLCRQRPEVIHVDHIADWDSFLNASAPLHISGMMQAQVFKINKNSNGDVQIAVKLQTNHMTVHTNPSTGRLECVSHPQEFGPGTTLISRDTAIPTIDPVRHPPFPFPHAALRQSGIVMSSHSQAVSPTDQKSQDVLLGAVEHSANRSVPRRALRTWDAATREVWDAEIDRVQRNDEAGSSCSRCFELIQDAAKIVLPGKNKQNQMEPTAAKGVVQQRAVKKGLQETLQHHIAVNSEHHQPLAGLWTSEFQPCTSGLLDPVQKALGLAHLSEERLEQDERLRQQLQQELDRNSGQALLARVLASTDSMEKMNRQRLVSALLKQDPNLPILSVTPKRRVKGGVVGDVVQKYPVRSRPIRKNDIAAMVLDNYSYPEYVIALARVMKVTKYTGGNKRQKSEPQSLKSRPPQHNSSGGSEDVDEPSEDGDAKQNAVVEELKEWDGKTEVELVYYYLEYPNYEAACVMLDRKIEHFKQYGDFRTMYCLLYKWDETLPRPRVSKRTAAGSADDMDEGSEVDEKVERSASDSDGETVDSVESSASETDSERDSTGRERKSGSAKSKGKRSRSSGSRSKVRPSGKHAPSSGTDKSIAAQRRREQDELSTQRAQLSRRFPPLASSHSFPDRLPSHPKWSSLYKVWISHLSLAKEMDLLERASKGSTLSRKDTELLHKINSDKSNPYTWHGTFTAVNDEFLCARPSAEILKTIPPFLTLADYATAGIKWTLLPANDRVSQSVFKEEILCWMGPDEAFDESGNMTSDLMTVAQAGLEDHKLQHDGYYADDVIEEGGTHSRRGRKSGATQSAAAALIPDGTEPAGDGMASGEVSVPVVLATSAVASANVPNLAPNVRRSGRLSRPVVAEDLRVVATALPSAHLSQGLSDGLAPMDVSDADHQSDA